MPETPLVYVDSYSGHEVLVVNHRGVLLGVVYDPRDPRPPIPWTSECRHCVQGRHPGLRIHTKREINMLMSRKKVGFVPALNAIMYEYRVPSNGDPDVICTWRTGTLHRAKLMSNPDHTEVTLDTYDDGWKFSDRHAWKNKILHRSLRFLFSEKDSSAHVVSTLVSPYLIQQSRTGLPVGNRNKCSKIDWATVVGDLIA